MHRKRIVVYVLYLLRYNGSKYELRRSSKFGWIVKKLSMKEQSKHVRKQQPCCLIQADGGVEGRGSAPPPSEATSEACFLLIIPVIGHRGGSPPPPPPQPWLMSVQVRPYLRPLQIAAVATGRVGSPRERSLHAPDPRGGTAGGGGRAVLSTSRRGGFVFIYLPSLPKRF